MKLTDVQRKGGTWIVMDKNGKQYTGMHLTSGAAINEAAVKFTGRNVQTRRSASLRDYFRESWENMKFDGYMLRFAPSMKGNSK